MSIQDTDYCTSTKAHFNHDRGPVHHRIRSAPTSGFGRRGSGYPSSVISDYVAQPSGLMNVARAEGRGHRKQHTAPANINITPATPAPQVYYEDIMPMDDEDVGNLRWAGFVTLVDHQGGAYRPRGTTPAAYGGFSDIWQCDTRFMDGSNTVVAVKKLRAVKLPPGLDKSQTAKRLLGRLKKELRIWMRLQHPNVAPLLGFAIEDDIAIISPWFSHGNISSYLEASPDADRILLIQGIARGLAYLHSSNPIVVHGDIKLDNVLIDKWGCPRIIDFGLSKLVEDDPNLSSIRSGSLRDSGNARWIAFGLLAFSLLTGALPFEGTPDGGLVIARYMEAQPFQNTEMYPGLQVEVWLERALRRCWSKNPKDRPQMQDVVDSFHTPSGLESDLA
ncbi:hypothetical protein FRB90_010204, partial [Tulasnella sp. 427]